MKLTSTITTLLYAALALMLAAASLAVQARTHRVDQRSSQGGRTVVRVTLKDPPPIRRRVLDQQSAAHRVRLSQHLERARTRHSGSGGGRPAQRQRGPAGDRTRVVLNLARALSYDIQTMAALCSSRSRARARRLRPPGRRDHHFAEVKPVTGATPCAMSTSGAAARAKPRRGRSFRQRRRLDLKLQAGRS